MATTSGSKAGTRVTLVANTFTDITTQFEALGNKVKVLAAIPDLKVGLVTAGQTPTDLPGVFAAGAIVITKPFESALDVYAYSLLGGDIWLTTEEKQVVNDTTGTTSS